MWELDYKESWVPMNWWFWTVVLEKTLESPLNYKEIKPVNLRGNHPWILTGRTDAEAELQYFGHLMQTADSLEKNLMLEKIEGDDKGWDGCMASPTQWTWVWVTPGVGDGQGGLECCSPWGRRVGHNWTDWILINNCSEYIEEDPARPKLTF